MDDNHPIWTRAMDADDWRFLHRFLLTSGSLKALAEEYDVSYPTIRARLDRLIAKVEAAGQPDAMDEFHRQLRILVAQGAVDSSLARRLLALHRESADSNQDGREES